MKPIGINCAVNILRSGSRHVIPFPNADPNGPGTKRDAPYFGNVPFRVHRAKGQPDKVQVSLLGEESVLNPFGEDTPIVPIAFGFAMRFYWEYSDNGGAWTPDGASYWQPFSNPGTVRWPDGDGLDINGSNLAVNGIPAAIDCPIRPTQDFPTDPAWEAGYLFSIGTDRSWRISEVRFFFGKPIAGPSITPVATPGASWNIVFDERADSGGVPGALTTSHTIGTFAMAGTEDYAVEADWPVLNPGLSWAMTDGDPFIWFNGLRIEQV